MKQAETASGRDAARAVGAAVKCVTAALSIARGLGGDHEAPAPNRLEAHLARRAEVMRLPSPKEHNAQEKE